MASSDSFIRQALPFALGLGFILFSPLLDYVTWRLAYEGFYKRDEQGAVAAEDLANGASWAVDLAQVLPGVLLAVAGVVLAYETIKGEVVAVLIVIVVVPLAVLAFIQRRANLHERDMDPKVLWYSLPQMTVALVDVAAIGVLAVTG